MGTVQEVRIAKRTGFCYGVREAIDKAKEASAAGKATHTLGQVVHNEGVVRDLQDLGIQTVESLDDVDHGAAVVIRAHGVRPDVMERAEQRGLEVIDGTCTWVIQEHRELTKIVNTVCPVTIRRQQDTLETAGEVDLMVVVGGRSSANTKELTRLCEIAGTTAIQIESVHDLTDPSPFAGARIVGVTGGTSTPIEDLRDVSERILEMAGTPDAQAHASELAHAALERAATPAGRTTSLPNPPRASDPVATS